MENFKDWLEIDDKIKEIKKELKDLEDEKKLLTGSVMEFMKESGTDECIVNDESKLRYSVSNVQVSLNKDVVETLLEEFFVKTTDFDKWSRSMRIKKITEYLYNQRPTTQRESLRRVKA